MSTTYDWHFQIESKTKEKHFNLIRCLFAIGYKSDNAQTAIEYVQKHGFRYPWTVVNPVIKMFSGNLNKWDRSKTITFNELLEFDSRPIVEVRLNADYLATVSCDGIKVGCQTFPLSVAQELLNAVESISSKKQ